MGSVEVLRFDQDDKCGGRKEAGDEDPGGHGTAAGQVEQHQF